MVTSARGRVGNHGIGPCCYRYIRAASSPAESLPAAEAGRAGLPGFARTGVQSLLPHRRAHLPGRYHHDRCQFCDNLFSPERQRSRTGAEDGELESLWLPTHPASNRRPHPDGFILLARKVHDLNVCGTRVPAAGFQPGTLPLGQPSFQSAFLPAEGGLFESHASQRASASNGARHACPVHPPRCRPRDSDPEPLRSGRSASANWARAAWSG